MPIYEYTCRDCHQEFETLLRGDEKPVCPYCGKRHLDKKFSVPAAHVVGNTLPVCPAREVGACGMGGCGGNGACGMMQ